MVLGSAWDSDWVKCIVSGVSGVRGFTGTMPIFLAFPPYASFLHPWNMSFNTGNGLERHLVFMLVMVSWLFNRGKCSFNTKQQ